MSSHDGIVEAVRQTVMAAQVDGAVVELRVRAGDRVRAGQVLLALDGRTAEERAGASDASVVAARARQEAATLEYQRQQRLFQRHYVSQAAVERAEAEHKAATAQVQAQLAAMRAAHTQRGLFVIKAPYDAVVAEVNVTLGEMALPGRPLATLFDPRALRVAVSVPESASTTLQTVRTAVIPVEVGRQRFSASSWEVLPAADPTTHTVVVRLPLPTGTAVAPGSFARAWLPTAGEGTQAVFIPRRALVERAELKGVYVLLPDGRALLRQLRLGPGRGDEVEVLAGLAAGESIALDPQAAARRP
jgi:RND family efflux transporter MFP subunit